MPLFVAIFEDKPDTAAIREATQAAHLAYLDRNRDRVKVGGALREEHDGKAIGGLWLIEAADRAEADRICKEDPFFLAGLRKSYRIAAWSRGHPKTPVTLSF